MVTTDRTERAALWRDYLATPRRQRGHLRPPPCYTCGARSDGYWRPGEPRYACRHDPARGGKHV